MASPFDGINLALAHEAIEAVVPYRDCLVWRDYRRSWRDIGRRSRRFAAVLRRHGFGHHRDRSQLAGWERGQDTVALLLRNGDVYLEAMLGSFKARCAPVNVNFRYTAEELAYVIGDSGAAAVVVDADLLGVLADALVLAPGPRLVLVVGEGWRDINGHGHAALDSSIEVTGYEEALAAAQEQPCDPGCTPDDLYVLYTGGTTGRPKGVLWRQRDFVRGALGTTAAHPAELAAAVANGAGATLRVLPTAPFMHGAAHWNAWSAWLGGGTVIVQSAVHRLDAHDVWTTAAAERVTSLQIVGDAFALPLVDDLHHHRYDLSHLRFVVSGGAVLSPAVKRSLLALVPGVSVVDIVGSSEAGRQGVHTSTSATGASTGRFGASTGATVLDEALTHELAPGDEAIGWLATAGAVPLGYLGDPDKTARTFPVISGTRFSVPGDRARRLADGSIELLGRDAATINTGGEKVFAEEVEQVLKHHPAVYDALVVGRPSERWGQEVAAVIALRPGAGEPTDDELLAACAEHLARYKLPKVIVRRPAVARSPSGKPDYTWARAQVTP